MASIREFFDKRRRSTTKTPLGGFVASLPERVGGATASGDPAAFGAPGVALSDGITVSAALNQPIGRDQIARGDFLLQKYASGKKATEQNIKINEQMYRLKQWEVMKQNGSAVRPRSAWLFNVLINKHADAMDNYPRPVVLPREPGDEAEAKALSAIIPVVLDNTDFEAVYSDVQMYKFKQGTGVYSVMWDPTRADGRGDIVIKKADLLNLFWEPGVTNVQDSPNLFHVYLVENEKLEAQYPQLRGKLGGKPFTPVEYADDNGIDNSTKTTVVEWYYKKYIGNKTVVHYVKYVGNEVLFATENGSPEQRERGLYDHGRYPFEFETVYTVETSPVGVGFIDIGIDAQQQIDRLDQAITENALQGAKPRYFERIEGSINKEEFNDFTKSIVHVSGNLGEDSVRPVDHYPLSDIYVSIRDRKIEELKETTGNRDVNSGGTTSGVTAASAIAAMQEAGAKLTRDQNKAAYRTYRQIILDVIELIRQFYDIPRQFRILGADGEEMFVEYQNTGLAPVPVKDKMTGEVVGHRFPTFDVKVAAEKESPFTRMAQNEFAFELYGKAIFDPNNADQALACLDMMQFDDKQKVVERVRRNGTMAEQIKALSEMAVYLAGQLDRVQGGGDNAAKVAAMLGGMNAPAAAPADVGENGGDLSGGEASTTAKARARVAESTAVR